MTTHKIVLAWLEGQQKWVATSQSPRGKALAKSPKTAVNRLKRSLALRQGDARFEVVVQLPGGAQTAIDSYFAAMAAADETRKTALSMQLELAELFLERYCLNRSQAAAAVGLSHSYLGKILDGKVLRSVTPSQTVDPAESIAEFVNIRVAERNPTKRNDKKR